MPDIKMNNNPLKCQSSQTLKNNLKKQNRQKRKKRKSKIGKEKEE